MGWAQANITRQWISDERGTVFKDAPQRIALCYPSPYRAAMSSLGFQAIYRQINAEPGMVADRAVLPDDVQAARQSRDCLRTIERETPVSNYPLVAFSIAYELELAGLIDCLDLSGIAPLSEDRNDRDPIVVAGGPLTFSNPAPMAPFFDVIIVGEGEELIIELARVAEELRYHREDICSALANRAGFYVPSVHGDEVPPVAQVDNSLLPARSVIITPNSELRSMYLTEAARGCSRGCTYCVMRRSTNGGMRVIPPERILSEIPEHAERVGLVGAAVTDHPKITKIVADIVASGREIGISSLRADKLNDEFVSLLAKGGYRTLTVAFDGASAALRARIERKASEENLLDAARLAAKHSLHTLKLYMMVGLPGETDDDIAELTTFMKEMRTIHPRIALGVAPFVAKRNTPLDGEQFAGIATVEQRLALLRKQLRQTATVRPTSARWAWVEYMLSQGTSEAGRAVLTAHRAGGRFADYKRAFQEHQCSPTGPLARVMSSAEKRAAHRTRFASLPIAPH